MARVHVGAVRLIGWCAEEKALVLELCAAGSLDVALPSLTWYQRLRVATHVARALLFLHMRRPEVSTQPQPQPQPQP